MKSNVECCRAYGTSYKRPGILLKPTGLYQKSNVRSETIVPFLSDCDPKFTIWFKKSLLDLFPVGPDFIGSGPLSPAAVKSGGETIGIILPCRAKSDIDIYQFVK